MTARTTWLDRSLAVLAFAVPFGTALARMPALAEWAGDVAIGKALGGSLGPQGVVSGLVIQASLLLPLGSVAFRAAYGSAIALGAIGWLVYALCRRVLAKAEPDGRLGAFVSLVAALAATLPATPLHEATVAGGASVTVLLVLLALLFAVEEGPTTDVAAVRAGALASALMVENAIALSVVTLSLLVSARLAGHRPARRAVVVASVSAAVTLGLLFAPALGTLAHGGRASAVAYGTRGPWAGAGALCSDMGVIALAAGVFGLVLGVARPESRPAMVAPSALVVLDLALAQAPAWLSGSGAAALDLSAVASLAMGGAVTVQAIAALLIRFRVGRGRLILGFVAMFDLALVVASMEEAAGTWGRSAGAERFADIAFETLPSRSVLLLRTEALHARLFAARVLSGTRPDVTIVPHTVFASARDSVALLDREPSLVGILRDMSAFGHPLEQSMTALADERTLEVELEPAWKLPIQRHLVPDHLWLRFAPEPRGPSDRRPAYEAMRADVAALLSAGHAGNTTDRATTLAAAARIKDCAALAADLGDNGDLARFVAQLEAMTSGDAFVAELARKSSGSKEPKTRR